jgi:TPR repeat protein
MKNRCLVCLMTLALMAAPVGAAHAGPLDDATAAYEQEDYSAALTLWRPLAEQGDPRAQATLGFLYANGLGVPLDYAEAARWYQRAAEQGDALAQGSLGFLYAHALGVPRDLVRAHAWFSLAAARSVGALQGLFAADRELAAARMDGQQIAAAELLARELDATVGPRQASRAR